MLPKRSTSVGFELAMFINRFLAIPFQMHLHRTRQQFAFQFLFRLFISQSMRPHIQANVLDFDKQAFWWRMGGLGFGFFISLFLSEVCIAARRCKRS